MNNGNRKNCTDRRTLSVSRSGLSSTRTRSKRTADSREPSNSRAEEDGKEAESGDETGEDDEDNGEDDEEIEDYDCDEDACSTTAATRESMMRTVHHTENTNFIRRHSEPEPAVSSFRSDFGESGNSFPTESFQEGMSIPCAAPMMDGVPPQSTFVNTPASNPAPLYTGEPFFSALQDTCGANMGMHFGPYGTFGVSV